MGEIKMMTHLPPLPDWRRFTLFSVVTLIGVSLIVLSFIGAGDNDLFCSESISDEFYSTTTTPLQLDAILHYATAQVDPQQSIVEITVSFDVLLSISPCNFLVFGLGHDSLMWASFNPRGKTLFLEEDKKWVRSVLKTAPDLNADTVNYRTKLANADELMNSYRSEPECAPSKAYIRNNTRCRLAITGLPDEVYDIEWDIIMIDASGRMGAIYSVAVMARNQKKPGVTHVFLHDVNRKVEKDYAEEFFVSEEFEERCRKTVAFRNTAGESARFC